MIFNRSCSSFLRPKQTARSSPSSLRVSPFPRPIIQFSALNPAADTPVFPEYEDYVPEGSLNFVPMKDPKAKLQLVEKEDPKVESKPVEKGLKDLKDHADDGLDKVSKNLKGFADDGLDKVSKAASQVMDQVLPR